MINQVGPAAIGAVVGWMLYYFIRLYRIFNPKTLGATLGAILGGEALSFLTHFAKQSAGHSDFDLWYFVGVSVGFFTYAAWAGVLALLYAAGKISTPGFKIAVACGAGIGEDLDRIERIIQFEELVEKWGSGDLVEANFRQYLFATGLTQVEYHKAAVGGDLKIDPVIRQKFEAGDYLKLLPASS